MSEQYAPIGQLMPSSQYASQQTPTISSGKNHDLSFQSVLDRQQMSSAQLKAMQAPQHSQNVPLNSLNYTQGFNRQNLTPAAVTPTTQAIPAESMDLINQMPSSIPQGKELEQALLQNIQDYNALKAKTPHATNSQPIMSSVEDIKTNQPLQGFGIAGAYHTALSNGQNTANTQALQPSEQLTPVIYPTPTPMSQLTEAHQLQNRRDLSEPSLQQNKYEETDAKPKKRGFFGAIKSFFKNVASGLTLGLYRPNNEPAPQGLSRITYPVKKLFYEAPIKDIAMGVPMGIYHDAGSALNKTRKTQDVPSFRTAAAESSTPTESRNRWTSLHGAASS
jgi:hypothetical protein